MLINWSLSFCNKNCFSVVFFLFYRLLKIVVYTDWLISYYIGVTQRDGSYKKNSFDCRSSEHLLNSHFNNILPYLLRSSKATLSKSVLHQRSTPRKLAVEAMRLNLRDRRKGCQRECWQSWVIFLVHTSVPPDRRGDTVSIYEQPLLPDPLLIHYTSRLCRVPQTYSHIK